ncbi:MAG: DnaJ-like chaperone protein [Pseudomonadota bacterium]|jgi:DnaJ like chaperone protein
MESRQVVRTRILNETRLGCYLYLGGSDGELSVLEVAFMRRECGVSQVATVPSREALARKIRSFLMGCRPSLRERRELLARLLEFAVCDGPLSSDEGEALKVIEDLLQVVVSTRKAQRPVWPKASPRASVGQTSTKRRGDGSTRRSWGPRGAKVRVERPQPHRSHWSYDYLGCTEYDTDETIKRAYRKLALKLHPDKHSSCAVRPEEIRAHLRAFQKLQQAYDEVCRLRGTSR